MRWFLHKIIYCSTRFEWVCINLHIHFYVNYLNVFLSGGENVFWESRECEILERLATTAHFISWCAQRDMSYRYFSRSSLAVNSTVFTWESIRLSKTAINGKPRVPQLIVILLPSLFWSCFVLLLIINYNFTSTR